jgi:hypothetical protein
MGPVTKIENKHKRRRREKLLAKTRTTKKKGEL